VAYDGSAFHGFAIQPNQRTVAGSVLEALSRVTGSTHSYTCAGRTDAGVHALAQVVHVDIAEEVLARRFGPESLAPGRELEALARSLSSQLAPEIIVYRALVVSEDFDARRSATARRYRYDLGVGRRADPLRATSSWWVGPGLDLAAMRLGVDPLIGPHDFTGFCRRPPGHCGPLERRVHEARLVVVDPDYWRFEIEANAFCHQMVRAIVGTLVAIGLGRLRANAVTDRLARRSREGAPTLAPPGGLCLVAVRYPPELGGDWT
jgi:tRNA pseudouridine38-40 synthase